MINKNIGEPYLMVRDITSLIQCQLRQPSQIIDSLMKRCPFKDEKCFLKEHHKSITVNDILEWGFAIKKELREGSCKGHFDSSEREAILRKVIIYPAILEYLSSRETNILHPEEYFIFEHRKEPKDKPGEAPPCIPRSEKGRCGKQCQTFVIGNKGQEMCFDFRLGFDIVGEIGMETNDRNKGLKKINSDAEKISLYLSHEDPQGEGVAFQYGWVIFVDMTPQHSIYHDWWENREQENNTCLLENKKTFVTVL